MIWNLSRTKPALPNSYFWTWDHRTNWVLDDPGILNFGCYNKYLKLPDTYISEYEKLIDFAAGLGIKGIVIWGFLRDSHGGIESAKHIASYGASKGVAILPGVGTTWYGGVYYEGEHRYNLDAFLRKNPDAKMIGKDGKPYNYSDCIGACPTNPLFREWIYEAVKWLFKEFDIGGVNFENGDYLLCLCPNCRKHKTGWSADDPDFFRIQALGYETVLEAVEKEMKNKLITLATYTGFVPGGFKPDENTPDGVLDITHNMHCDRPAMIDHLNKDAIMQWTITGMVHKKPLPLTLFLDNGVPEEIFDNTNWPVGLNPPSVRNTGYLHQERYNHSVGIIKEACLRAYRSGLEGVGIYGEVPSWHIPAALNYLAFSHFIHWPEDSLLDFGKKTLGQIFNNEKEGEVFAEIFAHWDAGTITDFQNKEAKKRASELLKQVRIGKDLEKWRFWDWLTKVIEGNIEQQTINIF
ncbi:MAG TPA: hypothetical protein PK733_05025 [Clostridiales bacterium]|nr:hypothetical protein [Clostridiales bacterium]